jgi:O-antigen/teichoic acid export membrane protein
VSRTARFVWAAGLGYANVAVSMAIGLWLTRFLLARVGPDALGVWLQLLQLLGYIGLVDLGVQVILARDVAAAAGRAGGWSASEELPVLIGRTGRIVLLWQTPVVAALAGGLWVVLAGRWPETGGPVGVAVAAYALLFPFRVGTAVLLGLQDNRAAGLIALAGTVLGAAVTAGLVAAGLGAYALVWGWVVGQAVPVGLGCLRAVTAFRPALPRSLPPVPGAELRRVFGTGAWQLLSAVGNQLAGGTDLIILGLFYAPETVFRYAATAKLVVILSGLVQTLCMAVVPGLSDLRAADREAVPRAIVAYTQMVMLVSGWLGCLALAANAGFVGWWVGRAFDLGGGVLVMLVAGMVLRHFNNCLAVALFASHRERSLYAVTFADGLVTAGVAVATAAAVGPEWLPVGSLVGVCAVSIPMNLWLLRTSGAVAPKRLAAGLGWWAVRWSVLAGGAAFVGAAASQEFWSLAALALGVTAGYAAVMAPSAQAREVGEYLAPVVARLGWVGRLALRRGGRP